MIYIDTFLWNAFCFICSWIGFFSITSYLLMFAVQQLAIYFPQNLKKKYSADWGLVTGASSGIGRAIAEKLAEQEINVVLVAADDPILNSVFSALQQKYPHCRFRKVGVNLGEESMAYMAPILEATKDIEIGLVFNNAELISTGFFSDHELERLRVNMECNAGCAVPITHHFLRKMLERNRRGLITFTSSVSSYIPRSTAPMYSSSKAFLTNFATALAAEVHDAGIDVVVIHSAPEDTNLHNVKKSVLNSLKMAKMIGCSPENIADQIFASAGRLVIGDHGLTCAISRFVLKIIDFQLLSELFVRFAWITTDHKKYVNASKTRRAKVA